MTHPAPGRVPPRAPGPLSRALALPLVLLVRLYQATLSPFLGGHCKHHPTCSRYAAEALQLHGALRGSWLTVRRLLRCHPFAEGGYDPVPGGKA